MSCFIGRVRYHHEAWFLNTARLARAFRSRQAETLLWKREAFRWEKEVRLLYLNPHGSSHGRLLRYSVDPQILITKITFDPRMDREMANTYAALIRDRLGFRGDITQSKLYRLPGIEVTL
jgi:hypothetical protein